MENSAPTKRQSVFYLLLILVTISYFKLQYFYAKQLSDDSVVSFTNPTYKTLYPDSDPNSFWGKIYEKAASMVIFKSLVQTELISSLSLAKTYTILTVFLFGFSSFILAKTVFRSDEIAIIFTALMMSSGFSNANLSFYSISGFRSNFTPLYYGISHSFGLIAIACIIGKKTIFGLIALFFAIICHVSLGLFYFVFVAVYSYKKNISIKIN